MTPPARPQLALAQRVAADVLASIDRPITIQGHAYTDFPCCESPKNALAWAVAEAEVAGTLWAALRERGLVRGGESALERRFACPVCFRRWWHDQRHSRAAGGRGHRIPNEGCPICRGAGMLTAPPTCVACVALAADPDGVCAAEARVADIARALAPWGASEPTHVIWCVRDQPHARAPVPLRLAAAGASISTRRPGMPGTSIGSDVERRAAWQRAVREDVLVQPRAGEGTWPTGAAFTALPDPFAALDALAELGYTLEDLVDLHAVVCAPPVELDGTAFGELVEIHDHRSARPGAWPR